MLKKILLRNLNNVVPRCCLIAKLCNITSEVFCILKVYYNLGRRSRHETTLFIGKLVNLWAPKELFY